MRKSYLLYAIGAGLALTACSSEENAPRQDVALEKAKSFYVNVAINTNSDLMTRADGNPDGFEKGLVPESQVNSVYFVFYDSNGVVVGQPVSVPVSALNTPTADSEDGNVLRSYTSIVQVDVNRGEYLPSQVMCYINPVSTDGLANSLQNVETITRQGYQGTGNGFSMSNSVYYPNRENATHVTRAAQIAEGLLYNRD